jgi:hypothetical protein
MKTWQTVIVAVMLAGAYPALAATPKEAPPATAAAHQAPVQSPGRYQLVVVPGNAGSPFLLDTATGCIWQQGKAEEGQRASFIEVDIENFHWSYGSGFLQTFMSRIDGSNLTDEQKKALKEQMQKTSCAQSILVLTPPAAKPAGQ